MVGAASTVGLGAAVADQQRVGVVAALMAGAASAVGVGEAAASQQALS